MNMTWALHPLTSISKSYTVSSNESFTLCSYIIFLYLNN